MHCIRERVLQVDNPPGLLVKLCFLRNLQAPATGVGCCMEPLRLLWLLAERRCGSRHGANEDPVYAMKHDDAGHWGKAGAAKGCAVHEGALVGPGHHCVLMQQAPAFGPLTSLALSCATGTSCSELRPHACSSSCTLTLQLWPLRVGEVRRSTCMHVWMVE